jgi:hypothetical protein
MTEDAQKLIDSLPKQALAWIVQACIALICGMTIYIFDQKLDEIDRKFDMLKEAQTKIETISNTRSDRLSDQQLIIINQINDIKLKLALMEQRDTKQNQGANR